MGPIKITSENFEQEIANSKQKIIVDFYADWCSPCQTMSPVIDEIAKENSSIKVGKVNIDEYEDLAEKYNVISIPTIIVFKDGQICKKFVGVTNKESILNVVEN